MKCNFGVWCYEGDEPFPTWLDRMMYLLANAMRCQKLIKYHSRNRWRLPRMTRIKCVEPKLRWHELLVGRYGFSWIKEADRG